MKCEQSDWTARARAVLELPDNGGHSTGVRTIEALVARVAAGLAEAYGEGRGRGAADAALLDAAWGPR